MTKLRQKHSTNFDHTADNSDRMPGYSSSRIPGHTAATTGISFDHTAIDLGTDSGRITASHNTTTIADHTPGCRSYCNPAASRSITSHFDIDCSPMSGVAELILLDCHPHLLHLSYMLHRSHRHLLRLWCSSHFATVDLHLIIGYRQDLLCLLLGLPRTF